MFPQITNALSKGFTSKQIIDFILKKFPKHENKIKSALAAGFTAEQVLKYLAGGKKALTDITSVTPEGQTEHEQTRSMDIQRRENVNKAALAAGTMAAGALASPMAAAALQRAVPKALEPMIQSLIGASQQETTQQQPLQPPNILPSSEEPLQQNIAQKPFTIQPEELIEKMGLTQQIKNMANEMSPKDIADVVENYLLTPGQKKWLKENTDQPLENIIKQFALQNKQSAPQEPSKPEGPSSLLSETEEEIPEKKPATKGETVFTSHGIGKVKEIRNDKALIETDGKIHKVSADQLIQSPISDEDLGDLYDDVIKGIEKSTGQQVSRNVEWAGYDPNTNELAYKPHGSSQLYVYGEIQPKDVEILTNFLTQRKSTGSNFIGAWEAGTKSPIGAAMYQLIKRLQSERGGKGNEYKNKYQTIYDALEPAKQAAKEKHEKAKRKAKKPRFD